MAAKEIVAEALWQAESLRAANGRRRESWAEQDDTLKNKWRFMAAAALDALLDADYGISPPAAKRK